MEIVLKTLYFFFMCLSGGFLPFVFIVDTQKTGSDFVKLCLKISTVSYALAGILATKLGLYPLSILSGFGVAIFLLILEHQTHCDERKIKDSIIFLIVISIQQVLLFSSAGRQIAAYFYLLASSLLLGSIVFGMILGHYYLVVPKLSEKPLLNVHYFIWAGVLTSLIVSSQTFGQLNFTLSMDNLFDWIVILMRVLWGYLAIVILSIFSYKLTKMRSIQSATGVLYVMVFFILIGEIISKYKFIEDGIFL
ncbi:MAG: hypothetical protein H6621_05225 [Halobacteriovoraceae bacterium]|nr:hypothetical protein [Halobacteriovoraceae bacterium]